MIGQSNLISKINQIIDKYPKFSIIVGSKGSGKKTIVKYICKRLGLQMVNFGAGIDEVREIIDLSYQQVKPICYVCEADTMSLGAKNALLKITEEPPNNAYFILTLQSLSNTLETIQSRATVFALDVYTYDELIEYRKQRKYSNGFDDVIRMTCSSTGDVDELFGNDVPTFNSFAQTVAFQIHLPTTGNIFKIPAHLKTSASGGGFDPILLFKAVRNLYINEALKTKDKRYLYAANVTSQCLRDLNIQTVNKVATIDKWIMDVRVALR